jgi:hypothetical protein
MSKSLPAGLFASATGTGTAGYTGGSRFAIDRAVLSRRSLSAHRSCSGLSERPATERSSGDGQCYRTRGSRRVIIQQEYGNSYNYVPRERYIERRGYYDGGYYNEGPGVGIGVGPGGVGVGFGVGPRW